MSLFDSAKKEMSILDIFTYDLTTFFYGQYEEIDSEETEGTFMIVYERNLPWIELDIFNVVQFRVFFDKANITGSNPINVKFIVRDQKVGLEDIKRVVARVEEIYGVDDKGDSGWTEETDKEVETFAFSRIWTIEKGESFVSVFYTEDEQLVLNILFFNNLIKHTGKYLDIKH